jgi:hypothetical protein
MDAWGLTMLAGRDLYLPLLAVLAIPILWTWFVCRRILRREYVILGGSLAVCCGSLAVLSTRHDLLVTELHHPSGAICTLQIPVSLLATTLLTLLLWRRPVFLFVPPLVGCLLLVPIIVF